MTIAAFDPILDRLSATPASVPEPETLGELWSHGEDGWLREDPRFRPTPWGRWIPADRYLINDLLVRDLRAGTSELSLSEQLGTLSKVVGRPTAICPADPRLRLEDDRVRLAPSELTAEPLLEEVGPLLQYVTHLPVVTLQAAAASEPAGEWGPKSEPQHVEPMGWLRVERLGKPLNRRMFVARVKGHSMDGGARPIEDGAWVIFEFAFHEGVAYDAGSDQPIVLVRGEFSDPETGSYAIKRWDRHAPEIRLVSANPDKQRFPDIMVPLDAADDLRIVAAFAAVLGPADFARRPRPERKPGRRVVEGRAGMDEQGARLERRIDDFFEGRPPPDDEPDATGGDGWQTRLVCLGPEAGGLHLEVGPLGGLPPFVKKLRVVGAGDRDGILLAANARQRATSLAIGPGSGPWRWEAVGFEEEDLGLERLAADALPTDAVTVFRVDAGGVGQWQTGRVLALGQAFRLLLPPGLGDEAAGEPIADGWRLWTVDLGLPPPAATRTSLQAVGLGVGEAWPRLDWALLPPAAWKFTPRGELYPVFERDQDVIVRVSGMPDEEDEAPRLFLRGPSGIEHLALPQGTDGLVLLGALAEGRWACALVHPRTEIRTTTLLFEVVRSAGQPVDTRWSVDVEPSPEGTPDLATLAVSAPPGWPVTLSWRVLGAVPLATVHAEADGSVDLTSALATLGERTRRARVGDLVVDLAELGREVVPHDRRPSVDQVREGLAALWAQRETLVRSRRGAWLTLVPHWFTPICELLGYGLEELVVSASMDAENGLAAWRLVVDERDDTAIRRSTARVLVVTADLDATLTGGVNAVDRACGLARVREAVVTDGVRWTTHRRGNRLRRPTWDLGEVLAGNTFEELLAALAEGLG
ncbi:MAG: hypothetical protein ABMA64_01020 [Myxococcota bacterium]